MIQRSPKPIVREKAERALTAALEALADAQLAQAPGALTIMNCHVEAQN